MGKYFLLLALNATISTNVFSQDSLNFKTVDENTGKNMLVGFCDRSAFSDTSFSGWFDYEYNSYQPDINTLQSINEYIDGCTIKIVMGTWCSDSRREVPRFYKILDKMGYPDAGVILINVNRMKKGLFDEADNLEIEFVPTIIIYKDSHEIGRIIEAPNTSLEKDLYEIVAQYRE